MEEIIGFSLSQEELLAAILIGQLRAPVGFDDLEQRVFGEQPEAFRAPLLAAAERGLVAHGLLAVEPEGTALNEAALEALRACTDPQRTWVLLHQPAGQAQRATYFHQRGRLHLAHIESIGVHQLLEIGGPQDLQATALQLIEPSAGNAAGEPVRLPEATFARIVDGATPLTRAALHDMLGGEGWSAEQADSFAATLEALVSITAFARFSHGADSQLELAFTIIRGQSASWVVRVREPGVLEMQRAGGEALAALVERFAQA